MALSVSPESHLCCRSIVEWRITVRGFESLAHQVNGADASHRFTGGGLARILLTVSTTTTKPSDGAFHDPTFR
jgi:hypothetical protein